MANNLDMFCDDLQDILDRLSRLKEVMDSYDYDAETANKLIKMLSVEIADINWKIDIKLDELGLLEKCYRGYISREE